MICTNSLVGRLGFTPVLLQANLLHIQKRSKRFHVKQVGKKSPIYLSFDLRLKLVE